MGARMLRDQLQRQGIQVGRRHITTLMQRMGIADDRIHGRAGNLPVTDIDWIKKAVQLFAFLMPSMTKLFSPAEAAEARAWISA